MNGDGDSEDDDGDEEEQPHAASGPMREPTGAAAVRNHATCIRLLVVCVCPSSPAVASQLQAPTDLCPVCGKHGERWTVSEDLYARSTLVPVQEGEGDGEGEAEGDEEEAGEARRASGGFDDHYDMDDDFIDDTEIHEYYGGDRRKTKYSGFFMNKARAACVLQNIRCFARLE